MKLLKSWFERLDISLSILIIIDVLLIIASILFNLEQEYIDFIFIFDTLICIVLIINFIIKYLDSADRNQFLKENYLDLVASLPLGLLILPFPSQLLYSYHLIILLRLLRVILLFKDISKYVKRFFNATYLDKIIAIFIVIIVGSTFTLYYFDPNIHSIYESLWFIFQTITTVGYGDIIPESPVGHFISLLLLIVGVLMFSVLTASFAYFFNQKIFKEENDEFNKKVNTLKENLDKTKESIDKIKEKTISNDEELAEIKENVKDLSNRMDYLIDLIEKKE